MTTERQAVTKSITVITAFYAPETAAAAKRLRAIADGFRRNGWDTRVITQLPNYPQGRINPDYGETAGVERNEDGIRVTRLKPALAPQNRLSRRLFAELRFIVKAVRHAARFRSDLIYVSSPYLLNGWWVTVNRRRLASRIIWEVRDLTWLYAGAAQRDRFAVGRFFEKLMAWTAAQVDAVITTTAGQAEYLAGLAPIQCKLVCPNGVSWEHFELIRNAGSLPKQQFTVIYAGLIGYPQQLLTFVAAAQELPEVRFVLIGTGVDQPALEQAAQERSIANLSFTGYLPLEKLAAYYRTADVLYAQLRDDPVFARTHPSKLWEYMAAGKPIIYGGTGEGAATLQTAGAGLVIPPEQPAALVAAITYLRQHPELAAAMGRNGQTFVLRHRIREDLVQRLITQIETLGREVSGDEIG